MKNLNRCVESHQLLTQTRLKNINENTNNNNKYYEVENKEKEIEYCARYENVFRNKNNRFKHE